MVKSGRYRNFVAGMLVASPALAPHFPIIRLKAKIPAFQAGDAVSRSAWWSKWLTVISFHGTCQSTKRSTFICLSAGVGEPERTVNPCPLGYFVRIEGQAPYAQVAELADAIDLGSIGLVPCGIVACLAHQVLYRLMLGTGIRGRLKPCCL